MAAGGRKAAVNTALFAGTVFKGAGTHSIGVQSTLYQAVKIQHFAQSAGNFCTASEGSSETTREQVLISIIYSDTRIFHKVRLIQNKQLYIYYNY